MADQVRRPPVPMVALLVATGFGLGRLRPAPGTWASAVAASVAAVVAGAVPAIWLPAACLLLAALATTAGLLACPTACHHLGRPDPGSVVIDEIAGVWLAMACLPATAFAAHPWPWTLAATAAFRVVDILKPWPIDRCERLPGAVGVVADDLAAGVLAGGTCHLLKVLASP